MSPPAAPAARPARRLAVVAAVVAVVAVLLATLAADTSSAARAGEPPGMGPRIVGEFSYARGRQLDVVTAGPATTARPVVVMIHGCCGDRADLTKLAEATAAAGAVVLSADWAGLRPGARFPAGYAEVACAVRFARARARDHGGDPGRVVLLGWSDGAMAAAVVGAAGDRFPAQACTEPRASAVPDAVVGVSGFYGWELPVPARYRNERAVAWLGGTPEQAPTTWREATPYGWLDSPGPACSVLLASTADPLREDARRYAAALRATGHRVDLREVAPAGDPSLISPRTAEGLATVEAAVGAVPCPGAR